MNVDAKNLTIATVLKKGRFIIPDYQREYEWQAAEIDEFLSDIDFVEEDDDYFIGSLVVTGEFSGEEFKVIDGQQRLTTITILLAALRDKLFALGEDTLANGLNTLIVNTDAKGKEYLILENKMPYPLLQAYVQSIPKDKNTKLKPLNEGEKKIKKAYDSMSKYISDYSKLEIESLRDKLLSLITVFVTVDTESNAFTIFETLNARGKDLSAFDLIKNQVFKSYPSKTGINEPDDSWNQIKKNIGSNPDRFLNYFWSSRYKKVAKRKMYKAFEQAIIRSVKPEDLPVNIQGFVEALREDSEIFQMIINPELSHWKSYKSGCLSYFPLDALRTFKVDIANAFLIALIRAYKHKEISYKYLVKALRNIEKFHFVYTAIGSKKGSGLDIFYAGMAKKLNAGADKQAKHLVLDQLEARLKDKIEMSLEEFDHAFQEKLVYSKSNTKNKALVKYTLDVFERVDSNSNKILLDDSIEHIYPETPTGIVPLNDEKNIYRIGNLVLLESGLNSELGNRPFADKRIVIDEKSSIVHTERVFGQHETWMDEQIENRTKLLSNRAFSEVWSI